MKKISKIYGGIYTKGQNQETTNFILDVFQQQADGEIRPFYLWETLAHNYMLAKQGIVPEIDAKKILQVLVLEVEKEDKAAHAINPLIGDVHENFETLLKSTIGESSGWVHVARSRNDEIITDQKLITKKLLFDFFHQLTSLSDILAEKTIKDKDIIMPGLTHFRIAMPSTLGFWWQSYLDQIIECQEIFQAIFPILDKSPLGAGASYGVNWPINTNMTTNDLGFAKPFLNSLAALNSRGVHELYVLSVLCTLSTILSRMMEDIVIFTMPEINYFLIDEGFTEGSSIMPQKINADVAEKIRSKVGKVTGDFIMSLITLKGTPSGYNKDSAETKIAILDGIKTMIEVVTILNPMLLSITGNKESMKKAVFPALATKLADTLTQTYKIPFRKAHHIVGNALLLAQKDISQVTQAIVEKSITDITGKTIQLEEGFLENVFNPTKVLQEMSYKGTPNPVFVKQVTAELQKKNKAFKKWFVLEEKKFYRAKADLLQKVKEYVSK